MELFDDVENCLTEIIDIVVEEEAKFIDEIFNNIETLLKRWMGTDDADDNDEEEEIFSE
jgi:ribosome assembly protein YihI (activator of Der GTPase)